MERRIAIATATAIVTVTVPDMVRLGRVCIVFGLDCNLHCKYCYRDIHKLEDIPALTEEFQAYLQSLDAAWCTAVCASGGEPLLYMDKIKEAFSYVPSGIHKKIMTNGILLTQEIVDYLNDHRIELHLSHDGALTKFLRGTDVLENARIRDLVRKVQILRVVPVITKLNCDIMQVYAHIHDRLGREDMLFDPVVVMDTGQNEDLMQGFDYDLYAKSYMEYCMRYRRKTPYYKGGNRSNGFNVLLDGTVVGMSTMSRYGTVWDAKEALIAAKDAHTESDYCRKRDCKIRASCTAMTQTGSPHVCRIQKIHRDISLYFQREGEMWE